MADRLTSLAVLAAVAALRTCATPAMGGALDAQHVATLRETTHAGASALGRYYAAANAAVDDAYVARARRNRLPVGRSEDCRLASGARSTRPTVLDEPLIPQASIAQRETVFVTIGAYETARAARLAPANATEVRRVDQTLQRDVAALVRVANVHERDDLFIDEAAAALAHEPSPNAMGHIVGDLFAILRTDVRRHRGDVRDAAALAYRQSVPQPRSSEMPSCSEPTIFARGALSQPSGDGRRGLAARRYEAALVADPLAPIDALQDLDERLTSGSPAGAAIARFATTTRTFAGIVARMR